MNTVFDFDTVVHKYKNINVLKQINKKFYIIDSIYKFSI